MNYLLQVQLSKNSPILREQHLGQRGEETSKIARWHCSLIFVYGLKRTIDTIVCPKLIMLSSQGGKVVDKIPILLVVRKPRIYGLFAGKVLAMCFV